MGLLSKIFRKKEEKKDNKKIAEKKAIDSTELTEEELESVCGYTPWCPKVDVPPLDLDIKSNQNNGRLAQNRSNSGR